jgi:hypothetical protein
MRRFAVRAAKAEKMLDTLRQPYLIVDDFMPSEHAAAMREALEAHLGNPYGHNPETHMVWDYWHVPGLYTYLRTSPDKVIGFDLAMAFQDRLAAWARDTLGLGSASWPFLSLYVHGCRQNQHNDSANGRFGYVYSLTKNERKTTGGETLIWREDDYSTRLDRPNAGEGFYHAIAPRFNRLLVFDDRMLHAVQLVEGIMDPIEGRLVMHGHIGEAGPIVDGPLQHEAVVDLLAGKMRDDHLAELGEDAKAYHGVAVIRLDVEADGHVADCRLVVDRVKNLGRNSGSVPAMLARLQAQASRLRFPAAAASSTVTIPVSFGERIGV